MIPGKGFPCSIIRFFQRIFHLGKFPQEPNRAPFQSKLLCGLLRHFLLQSLIRDQKLSSPVFEESAADRMKSPYLHLSQRVPMPSLFRLKTAAKFFRRFVGKGHSGDLGRFDPARSGHIQQPRNQRPRFSGTRAGDHCDGTPAGLYGLTLSGVFLLLHFPRRAVYTACSITWIHPAAFSSLPGIFIVRLFCPSLSISDRLCSGSSLLLLPLFLRLFLCFPLFRGKKQRLPFLKIHPYIQGQLSLQATDLFLRQKLDLPIFPIIAGYPFHLAFPQPADSFRHPKTGSVPDLFNRDLP